MNVLLAGLLAVCLLAFDVSPAQAYDDNAWIKETIKKQRRAERRWREWDDDRNWRPRRHKPRIVIVKHEPKRRHRHHHDHCKPYMSGVGRESYDLDTAKATAQADWMERVKWRWGIRFADPGNVMDPPTFSCARSGSGDRKGEKVMKLIPKAWKGGDYLQQCEMIARPCAAPALELNEDD